MRVYLYTRYFLKTNEPIVQSREYNYCEGDEETIVDNCVKLILFKKDKLFDENIISKIDENEAVNMVNKFGSNMYRLFEIDLDSIDKTKFDIKEDEFKIELSCKQPINKLEFVLMYDSCYTIETFSNLNWINLGPIIKNTKQKIYFPNYDNNGYNDFNTVFNMILNGSEPQLVLRALNLKDKIESNNLNQSDAKEIYDLFYDFSFSDWFDINSEGYPYYECMKYLRDTYNVDPNYK
jgi:hypothetical protein